jgi:hypothetical protein
VSRDILVDREEHFCRTLSAIEGIWGRPLLIKNPWNSFRATYLARALPEARFIWLRRDIAAAALSDLEARYLTKAGDANAWNSATPSNVESLKSLRPGAQVVENQYEFNNAIERSLQDHAAGRWVDVWYEDFLTEPEQSLDALAQLIDLPVVRQVAGFSSESRSVRVLGEGDEDFVRAYVDRAGGRLAAHRYIAG